MLPPSMNDELARQDLHERLDRAQRRMAVESVAMPASHPVRHRIGRWMTRFGSALNPEAPPNVVTPGTPDAVPAA